MLSEVKWAQVIAAALFGGVASRWIGRGNTKRTEVNKAIDAFRGLVDEIEDKALDYWLNPESSVIEYQLVRLLKRLSNKAGEIKRMDARQISPTTEIRNFRQAITLYSESDPRPADEHSERVRKIIRSSELLNQYYKKPSDAFTGRISHSAIYSMSQSAGLLLVSMLEIRSIVSSI